MLGSRRAAARAAPRRGSSFDLLVPYVRRSSTQRALPEDPRSSLAEPVKARAVRDRLGRSRRDRPRADTIAFLDNAGGVFLALQSCVTRGGARTKPRPLALPRHHRVIHGCARSRASDGRLRFGLRSHFVTNGSPSRPLQDRRPTRLARWEGKAGATAIQETPTPSSPRWRAVSTCGRAAVQLALRWWRASERRPLRAAPGTSRGCFLPPRPRLPHAEPRGPRGPWGPRKRDAMKPDIHPSTFSTQCPLLRGNTSIPRRP